MIWLLSVLIRFSLLARVPEKANVPSRRAATMKITPTTVLTLTDMTFRRWGIMYSTTATTRNPMQFVPM